MLLMSISMVVVQVQISGFVSKGMLHALLAALPGRLVLLICQLLTACRSMAGAFVHHLDLPGFVCTLW
jgi:hypothetical protein